MSQITARKVLNAISLMHPWSLTYMGKEMCATGWWEYNCAIPSLCSYLIWFHHLRAARILFLLISTHLPFVLKIQTPWRCGVSVDPSDVIGCCWGLVGNRSVRSGWSNRSRVHSPTIPLFLSVDCGKVILLILFVTSCHTIHTHASTFLYCDCCQRREQGSML